MKSGWDAMPLFLLDDLLSKYVQSDEYKSDNKNCNKQERKKRWSSIRTNFWKNKKPKLIDTYHFYVGYHIIRIERYFIIRSCLVIIQCSGSDTMSLLLLKKKLHFCQKAPVWTNGWKRNFLYCTKIDFWSIVWFSEELFLILNSLSPMDPKDPKGPQRTPKDPKGPQRTPKEPPTNPSTDYSAHQLELFQ